MMPCQVSRYHQIHELFWGWLTRERKREILNLPVFLSLTVQVHSMKSQLMVMFFFIQKLYGTEVARFYALQCIVFIQVRERQKVLETDHSSLPGQVIGLSLMEVILSSCQSEPSVTRYLDPYNCQIKILEWLPHFLDPDIQTSKQTSSHGSLLCFCLTGFSSHTELPAPPYAILSQVSALSTCSYLGAPVSSS